MENNGENQYKHSVHRVLAHSYIVYFLLFLVGVSLDLIFRFKIFTDHIAVPAGIAAIIFATFLILSAQITSRNLKKENITKETFSKGPYRYTRSPTHWGLFFLVIGFGVIANAVFIILTSFLSFLISKFIFLPKEEAILEKKYGVPYTEYKKAVRL